MINLLINDVDKVSYMTSNSLSIDQALNSQVDTCTFTLENYKPTEGQTIKIYSGLVLTNAETSGASKVCELTYSGTFNKYQKFRINDVVTIGAGTVNAEEATITAIGSGSVTATLANNHSAGELVSKKIFGGVINSVKGEQIEGNTSYTVYTVECVDWTKKLDRKLVNNVYTERTADYIILDVLNNNVNYNQLIDDFEYADVAALRAIWIESSDGGNPTRETSDFKEGDVAANLPWTFAGGTAIFDGAFSGSPFDISDFVGATSGTPTKGTLIFWLKLSDYTKVTKIDVRLGSDPVADYIEWTDVALDNNSWQYIQLDLVDGSKTGTPVWTATDYVRIIVTETASSSCTIDGLRVNADGYFTMNNVPTTSPILDDVRWSFKEPSLVFEDIAKIINYQYYIDYDQDIHLFEENTEVAPFSLTDTSYNYGDLSITPDVSQLVNTVYIRGGTEASAQQTEIYKANGTDDTFYMAESPRTVGYDKENDYAVYDFDMYIDVGAGYVLQTVGIQNVDDPTAYEWLLNPAEKYVKPGTDATPADTNLIKFVYTYDKPILVKSENGASIAAMKTLIGGDGIIEHAIEDSKILSTDQAFQYATNYLNKYSNAIVTLDFTTNYEGLNVGQIINLTNTQFGYSVEPFLIQRLSMQLNGNNDFWEYRITASTSLFGIVELFKLLLIKDFKIDAGQEVGLIQNASETINLSDSGSGGTIDSDLAFKWGVAAHDLEWDLGSWS